MSWGDPSSSTPRQTPLLLLKIENLSDSVGIVFLHIEALFTRNDNAPVTDNIKFWVAQQPYWGVYN